ncbi:malonate decarboxylase holo-[acyl-carrier-protein] synthase [Methylibium sp.]|jgi:phosphoribosyl-dephospho-CoA transferase|uniref:malonate decarboxylase holo-[acyl-carrier-protein] synthase n=1 Tax=Methylibium sp. TaxID=2067992 RepID=UPI003D0A8067
MEASPLSVRPWRHRRVWLAPDLGAAELAGLDDAADAQAVVDWAQAGRPFIGRATQPGDGPGRLPLGLALPPQPRKRRLSFTVAPAAVRLVSAPPTLGDALAHLPPRLREPAALLESRAFALGLPVYVFGSAFWQQASGLVYLTEHSDLDVLACPPSAAAARDWLHALTEVQADSAARLDGEIQLPDGAGVAWRELAAAPTQLLLKSDHGPALRELAAVWAAWGTVSAPC